MQSDQHIWKTGDGRLVTSDDPDAAVLVYAPGDQIAKEDEARLPVAESDKAGESKAQPAPQNKARSKPADK